MTVPARSVAQVISYPPFGYSMYLPYGWAGDRVFFFSSYFLSLHAPKPLQKTEGQINKHLLLRNE